jgi:hypothetical protein
MAADEIELRGFGGISCGLIVNGNFDGLVMLGWYRPGRLVECDEDERCWKGDGMYMRRVDIMAFDMPLSRCWDLLGGT